MYKRQVVPLNDSFNFRKKDLTIRSFTSSVKAGGAGKDTSNNGRSVTWNFLADPTLLYEQKSILQDLFTEGSIEASSQDSRKSSDNERAALNKIRSHINAAFDSYSKRTGYEVGNSRVLNSFACKNKFSRDFSEISSSVLENLKTYSFFIMSGDKILTIAYYDGLDLNCNLYVRRVIKLLEVFWCK